MNKKEVAEIKRNFNDKSGYFTMNAITTAYIDGHKEILNINTRPTTVMPSDEFEVLSETLKCVLSTSIGKAFVEYDFPKEAYEAGAAQDVLYKVVITKLKDAEAIYNLLKKISDNLVYEYCYSVVIGYCTYTVRQKNKNDEYNDDNEEYDFILTAICPAQRGCDGFIFNEDENEIAKKSKPSLAISKKPTDGFLYPTFSMRSPDVNHIMYFTKTPKKPNISMVENVLQCNYTMSAENEKEEFYNVLQNVLDEDLDFGLITTVNEKLEEIIEINKNETEPPTIDSNEIKNILSEIGVKEDNLKALSTIYEETLGDNRLTVSNLVESKTIVTLPDITVNIKNTAKDKFRTAVIDGRTVLLIDLDDPYVEINGLSTKIVDEVIA
ncbi:MAG: DUF4317 domain-containing protein [Oscillospiraceae bacterium]|jgi:hypothetical protein|nr:DUF4317 domain-containing protein [Oscillospiraceae bacterium]